MISEHSIEIDAPASVVWSVFAETERWAEWTPSVVRVVGLDGADLAVSHRFEIKQPRVPKLVWAVTELDPGRSWTWRQKSFGSVTDAEHVVEPLGTDRTLVTQRIDQRGWAGAIVARLLGRMTRRYLDMEATGLKEASEARHGAHATDA